MTVDIPKCGNLAIFLPLWFKVKSIFADFSWSKTVVLTILEGLNFWIYGHFTLEMVKTAVLGASKWPKLIGRKILKFSHLKTLLPNCNRNQNMRHFNCQNQSLIVVRLKSLSRVQCYQIGYIWNLPKNSWKRQIWRYFGKHLFYLVTLIVEIFREINRN